MDSLFDDVPTGTKWLYLKMNYCMIVSFLDFFNNIDLMTYDDFTLLFSGFLLTLSVYHFLLYFQHKDRVYLYYSFYTFLIFTSSYPEIETTISKDLFQNNDPYFNLVIIPREWIYNTLYLIFAKTLVEFSVYKPKWNRILNYSIIVYFVVLAIFMIIGGITGNFTAIRISYIYFFSPTIPVLALISFYHLYTMDTVLKYYLITGSFIYMVFAETAFYLTPDEHTATIIFYIGVIIENILFSLALGAKQKSILEDKNVSQDKLITQLRENERLKLESHRQLEQNVELLSQQAKEEKFERVKARYEKELTELKMSSLRSQMNPHFIFNSLNSIKVYIINNEKENAVYYLNKFSKLIRKILATTQEKEITLEDEIETMELYLKIENIRFNNKIEYDIAIDKNINIGTIKIPCLIMQPFIENALWHGLSLKKGCKKLDIIIENDKPSHIKIKIIDNGIGRTKSQEINKHKMLKRKSIGIKLTEERLKNFFKNYQNSYALNFTDLYDKNNNPKGTKVVIWLSLI